MPTSPSTHICTPVCLSRRRCRHAQRQAPQPQPQQQQPVPTTRRTANQLYRGTRFDSCCGRNVSLYCVCVCVCRSCVVSPTVLANVHKRTLVKGDAEVHGGVARILHCNNCVIYVVANCKCVTFRPVLLHIFSVRLIRFLFVCVGMCMSATASTALSLWARCSMCCSLIGVERTKDRCRGALCVRDTRESTVNVCTNSVRAYSFLQCVCVCVCYLVDVLVCVLCFHVVLCYPPDVVSYPHDRQRR